MYAVRTVSSALRLNCLLYTAKTLEEEGYQIEAVTNKGYRLSDGNEKLSEYSILRQLETEELGKKLYLLPSVDSTNNYAKTLAANDAPHGTAVVAEMQTGGRGRLGRSFLSPAGEMCIRDSDDAVGKV